MRSSFKTIGGSLFFAILLILSAWLLKGNEVAYWIEGSIYMAWIYFIGRNSAKQRSCLSWFKKANRH